MICKIMRRRNDSRYEQCEVSTETIEQELRPVVCKQRQTDRFYPFRLSYVYIGTKSQNRCDSCTYIYIYFAIEIWGFYRRLTDTLRYHHTRCSRASGLQLAAILQHVYKVGRKVEFTRSCPVILASFGKLRLSDRVQYIACHGIQRRIIWIFCRESEVSGYRIRRNYRTVRLRNYGPKKTPQLPNPPGP